MIYNQFSAEYNELYAQNLLEFQKRARAYYEEDLRFVDFYPSFGTKSDEKIDCLFYGQAVGEWGSDFHLKTEIAIEEKVPNSIRTSNCFCYEKNHCPLDWVNVQWTKSVFQSHLKDEKLRDFYEGHEPDYWPYRSFFWNAVYKTVRNYFNLEDSSWDWSKKIVWSNLYKIGPGDSNPNTTQMFMQQPKACELVKREIEELNPKFCIVLTNRDWWLPFGYHLKSNYVTYDKLKFYEIVSLEEYNSTKIVVTSRRRWGNGEIHALQIAELLKLSLES